MAQIAAGAGANGDIFGADMAKTTEMSTFDLSRITNLTGDAGMIIPFDYIETIPKDKFKVSAEVALESMPTITNMLTPYHVRTHWYYMRNSDLWAGWNTAITKGRTGNINWSVPQININEEYTRGESTVSFSVPHALQTFLGVPPKYGKRITEGDDTLYLSDTASWAVANTDFETDYTQTGYKSISDGVSALPFMMYQAIVKYNYVDQNLLQDNHTLYPEEGDSDWRIPAKGNPEYINALKYEDNQIKAIHSDDLQNASLRGIYRKSDTIVNLLSLRYAQYEDDSFTTALPWPQRGTAETLDFELNTENLEIAQEIQAQYNAPGVPADWPGSWHELENVKLTGGNNGNDYTFTQTGTTKGTFEGPYPYGYILGPNQSGEVPTRWKIKDNVGTQIAITANDLRQLLAMSVWQERNAQVNGSYNSMVWIHYKTNPHTADHYPIYIGGTSDYINFGEVISTAETSENPQGTITSNGKVYMNQEVGEFECPDYGLIMGIMIITPMSTYNQTMPKELFKKTSEDFYWPEFDNLGPQPILNKEIYQTGTAETDNDLFGYAKNRYYWMKSRQNVNRGLFQLPSIFTGETATDSLFSAGTQAREFESLPSLSYQFKVMDPNSTRKDWLAYPKEPMFKIQVASKIRAIRPMSYNSQPETFGF